MKYANYTILRSNLRIENGSFITFKAIVNHPLSIPSMLCGVAEGGWGGWCLCPATIRDEAGYTLFVSLSQRLVNQI